MEDDDEVLWIGSYSKGLIYYKNGIFEKFKGNEILEDSDVFSLLKTSDNKIWVGTYENGVFRICNGEVEHFTVKDGLKSNRNIRALFEDSKNKIWIGTEKGLNIYKDNKLKDYILPDCEVNSNVFSICEDRNGSIWVGGFGGGLIEIKEGRYKVYNEKDGLTSTTVRSLLLDNDGNLWIGSNESGVSRFYNGKFDYINVDNGLTNDSVRKVYEDIDGLIWLGTRDGLNRLKDGIFTSFSKKEGLKGNLIRTVFYDKYSGITYVGTANDGLYKFQNNVFITENYNMETSSRSVFSIYKEENGPLWIGTYGGGVILKNRGRITSITTKNGLTNNYVRAFLKDSKNRMWVGTRNGLSLLEHGKVIKTYLMEDGLSHNYVRVLHETDDGSIWVGTWSGLNRIKDGKITIYGKKDGLVSDNISSIYEDSEGILWIGTYRGGLSRFKDATFKNLTKYHGLVDDIYSVIEDGIGNFWIGSKSGVMRVKLYQLNDFLDKKSDFFRVYRYGKEDGMKSSTCSGGVQNTVCKMGDGKICFATVNGITYVTPDEIKIQKIPKTIIEKVFVDKKQIDFINNEIILPPGKLSIEIHFSSLDLINYRKTKFYYNLEPYDGYWVDAGSRTVAYYTNISPGKYVFQVKAAASIKDIKNAKPSTIRFTKKMFFYESKIFYLCIVVFIFLTFLLLHIKKLNDAKLRQIELEKLVDARTFDLHKKTLRLEKAIIEIQNAKVELSRINEKLYAVGEYKNELIGIVAHDLKSPIAAIKGYCELLSETLDDKEKLTKGIGIINKSSNKMLNLIEKLLEKTSLETDKIDLTLEPINLMDICEDIILSFKYIFLKKNQSVVFEIKDNLIINGDLVRIREIIENLISNASKYSPYNSKFEIKLYEREDFIVLSIIDEGPGMTDEDKKNLFGKYKKLSAKPTGGESSTGLGLYIVKKLVELHKGFISMSSEVGKGSIFTVKFPQFNNDKK